MLFCRPDFDVSIRTLFASDYASTYPSLKSKHVF